MDPVRGAQHVLLCDSCETEPLQSHCELCHINLCIVCVDKHLSDFSKEHNVVSYINRISTLNYQKCLHHTKKRCELYCEKCDIPVCSTCVTSGKHKGHDVSDVQKKLSSKTQEVQKDLEELETRIYPRYEEIVSDIRSQKTELETNCRKLTTAADQQEEVWHREITAIVNQRKSDIAEMKSKHLDVLDKHTDEITHKIKELRQIIEDLKKILISNDVTRKSFYKSRNSEFRRLPPTVQVILPNFSPQEINTDQLKEMFGSLSSLCITKKHGYTMKSPEAVSSPPVKPLLDNPRITATLDTGYRSFSVTCASDNEIWTRGYDKTMKLHNLEGKLLTSIPTESGNTPQDIAMTRDGDLVYTDTETRTINIVKNKQIQTVVTLQGWGPRNICSASSGDLLVTMISDDNELTRKQKVVRYTGFTETQTIQFDDQGQPLYSSDVPTYISENRNMDICVADYKAKAVVVVNQSGKLRFRYTGHPSDTKESFNPVGITTDSQSHILTADCDNHRIHILDQDGQFLRYIHNCGLRGPWGLCVDTRDNLFVTEFTDNGVRDSVRQFHHYRLLSQGSRTAR
ncbi:E3 ubiquitin-protein ligase TRIM71-like [Ostrea edulis]|uniref:E3 ubiquitin-protein ligase TRIM71-like n=1 Tax=Ostrea edulis TaxID=37623 RepID=UPI0024AEE998|nr:E3 ubiquitin-protein ligase TRIM71-like [Ostrea edulis]XP_048768499.2 E3 ubiquitin-protein ligase TRIM71-like [Ostrea edulis]XP_056015305.1 E3 ubiquitin-protein ligase TRIM71-like [Ostrea edulis]